MGTGLGMLGLAAVLRDEDRLMAAAPAVSPLAPKPPHFAAKAKHIIHIYLNGGPSQVDTFDPKPLLSQYDGQVASPGEPHDGTRRPVRRWARRSSFASTAKPASRSARFSRRPPQHVDDMCFIRSMHANTPNHEQSMRLMNCGERAALAAESGRLGDVRPGDGKREPARLHRHVPRPAGRRRVELAGRVPAGHLSGNATWIRARQKSRS